MLYIQTWEVYRGTSEHTSMNKSTSTCRVHLLVAGLLIMAAATGVSGQCEVQRIVPEGMTDGAMFGTAVCRWDQWLAVGAPLDTGNEWASGIVRVYQRKRTSWIREGKRA